MQVVNQRLIDKFTAKHALSRQPLARWMQLTKAARWKKLIDVQHTFSDAEEVKGKIVFNIHGNKFRLIAVIDYETGQVFVKDIMTHAQYDRWQP
jgi:mRNA interferase HigB